MGYLRSQGVADPEDATSEVFVRAFSRWSEFTGTSTQLRSWVFTIAHNVMIDDRRRRTIRGVPESIDFVAPMIAGHVEDEAIERLGADRVVALLEMLQHAQREVLALRFVAGLSLAEVAEVTGRNEGAVKALQHRALARLRRYLRETSPQPVSLSVPVRLPG